ncbi:MAG TPA: DUF5615 family PIN-like protein [Gemmatimonadaceae bacterium]|nr:DUF5615 family PIN-like protein [Gemmatimonadaceae bacterium]
MAATPLRVWLDAQLPPALARWLRSEHGVEATHVVELDLLHATDAEIFRAARAATVVVAAKDADFLTLLERHGPPPQLLWVTCGNVSNARLRAIFQREWPRAAALLQAGEPLVEVRGAAP